MNIEWPDGKADILQMAQRCAKRTGFSAESVIAGCCKMVLAGQAAETEIEEGRRYLIRPFTQLGLLPEGRYVVTQVQGNIYGGQDFQVNDVPIWRPVRYFRFEATGKVATVDKNAPKPRKVTGLGKPTVSPAIEVTEASPRPARKRGRPPKRLSEAEVKVADKLAAKLDRYRTRKRRALKKGGSRFYGVFIQRGVRGTRYMAAFKSKGVQTYVGSFKTETEAGRAVLAEMEKSETNQ